MNTLDIPDQVSADKTLSLACLLAQCMQRKMMAYNSIECILLHCIPSIENKSVHAVGLILVTVPNVAGCERADLSLCISRSSLSSKLKAMETRQQSLYARR